MLTATDIIRALARVRIRPSGAGLITTIGLEPSPQPGSLPMLTIKVHGHGKTELSTASIPLPRMPSDERELFDMVRDALVLAYIMGLEATFLVDNKAIYPDPTRPTGILATWFRKAREKISAPS